MQPLLPSEYGVFSSRNVVQNAVNFSGAHSSWGEHGALLTFDLPPSQEPLQHSLPSTSATLLARVAVSFISTEQACSSAEEEVPTFDFEGTAKNARSQWNELLGRIQVGAGENERDAAVLFYSSVR